MSFGLFLMLLAMHAAVFMLGYWVSSHPTDARAFIQRARDAFWRLIHKT